MKQFFFWGYSEFYEINQYLLQQNIKIIDFENSIPWNFKIECLEDQMLDISKKFENDIVEIILN